MKKYAIAGASSRCWECSQNRLLKNIRIMQIVGIFDINRTRAEYFAQRTDAAIPVYTDFDKMIMETGPDIVIIATVDRYHDEYAVRAMESGCV